jgi:predicted transposase YdaD
MGETDVTFRHVLAARGLTKRDRQDTMRLLYYVAATTLGSDAARRIFHVNSIIQDPNVQELLHEWKIVGLEEGRAQGREEGGLQVSRALLRQTLALRSFELTAELRARIDAETDFATLEAWHATAVTAPTIDDVFRDGSSNA